MQWYLFCSWPELESHPPISLLGTWFLQSGLCWVSSPGADPLPAGCEVLAANATEASCMTASQYWSQCSLSQGRRSDGTFVKQTWTNSPLPLRTAFPSFPAVWSQLKKLTVISQSCPPYHLHCCLCYVWTTKAQLFQKKVKEWKIRTSWQIQDSKPLGIMYHRYAAGPNAPRKTRMWTECLQTGAFSLWWDFSWVHSVQELWKFVEFKVHIFQA